MPEHKASGHLCHPSTKKHLSISAVLVTVEKGIQLLARGPDPARQVSSSQVPDLPSCMKLSAKIKKLWIFV